MVYDKIYDATYLVISLLKELRNIARYGANKNIVCSPLIFLTDLYDLQLPHYYVKERL